MCYEKIRRFKVISLLCKKLFKKTNTSYFPVYDHEFKYYKTRAFK